MALSPASSPPGLLKKPAPAPSQLDRVSKAFALFGFPYASGVPALQIGWPGSLPRRPDGGVAQAVLFSARQRPQAFDPPSGR
jgi:hypothetical protein